MARIVIERTGMPGFYDQVPYGSICKAFGAIDNGIYDMYIQLNEDDNDPKWELVGSFSEFTPNDIIDKEIEHIKSLRH